MTKWNLIIDIEKCEDCNNCFLACKDEHVDNEWPGYTDSQPRHGHRWINILRKERGQFPLIDVAYRPTPCMHCDDAPCIAAAEGEAISKRDDGIVLIDPQKAKGQKNLVKSCPYGAIWWNAEKNVPQKCTLCAHLLDTGWKEPRCVQVCPTGALKIARVDDSSMQAQAENEGLEILFPEQQTRPRVYYKNLHRYACCFIAGSVAVETGETLDCAQGAAVALVKDDAIVAKVIADKYGDFKFEKIEPGSGTYRLEVAYKEYAARTITVELAESVSLKDIVFG
jgi:Fe-S-cluster-containing dehydrogenase component